MIRFQLFGRPQILLHDSQSPPQLRSRKIEALLYFLVASRAPQRRTKLASLLWPDTDDKKAASNLRYALWNLRQVFPELNIESDRSNVSIRSWDHIWVDVGTFQTLVEQIPSKSAGWDKVSSREITRLQDLANLYQGEFLEGFELDDASLFDEWLQQERARFHNLAVDMLDRLGIYYSNQHQLEKALHITQKLIQIEPWREETHRQLMLLLALNGERTAAITHYETLCTILDAELAISPSPETEEMVERIRTGLELFEESRTPDRELEKDQFKNLPFFGRETEFAWLVEQWETAVAGKSGLILIEGESGSGKSRLIQELSRYAIIQGGIVIHGRCFEFNDPIPYQPIFAALQPVLVQVRSKNEFRRVDDFDEVLDTLTEILEFGRMAPSFVPEHHTNRYQIFEITTKFVQTISSKQPILFFMDDLQWIDSETLDLLSYLVRKLSHHPVLIIGASRPGEAQSDHPLVNLDRPSYNEGLDKKIELSPLPRDQIKSIVQTAVSVREIGPLVHFLTEISQGNLFIISDILQEMKDRGWLRPNDENQWQLDLPQTCLLGEFVSYTKSAHILCDPHASCGSKGKIMALNDFLQLTGERFEKRKITSLTIPEREEALILNNTKDRFRRRIARLPVESQNLLAFAAIFAEPFNAVLLQSASKLPLMTILDYIEDWIKRKLIKEIKVEIKSINKMSYLPAADNYYYDFNHQLIRTVIYEQISNVRRQSIHLELGNSLESHYSDRISSIVDRLAYHFHCAAHSQKALRYLHRAGQRALGTYALPKALECFQLALAYWEQIYDLSDLDVPQEAWQTRWDILLSQSEVSRMLGQLNNRISSMNVLVQEISDLGNDEDRMQVIYQQLADLEYSPDLDQRRALAREGISLAERLDDETAMGSFLQAAAECDRDMARHQEALVQYEAALNIFTSTDETTREMALCLVGIGRIHMLNNRFGQALAHFERASNLAKMGGHQDALIQALNGTASLYLLLGGFEGAVAASQNALNLCEYLGFDSAAAVGLTNLAQVNMLLGNLVKAEGQLDRAWGIAQNGQQTLRMAEVQCVLGHLNLHKGRPELALDYFKLAETLCNGFNHSIAIESRSYRAIALMSLSEFREARVSSHHAIVWMIGREHTLPAPQRIHWNQYQVLLAEGEAVEAQQALVTAFGHVETQMKRLSEAYPSSMNVDEIEHLYLSRLKWNQEIITEWDMLPIANSRVALHRVHGYPG